VAVHDGERFVGILEDIDLLGFLAGSAQVVAGRIDRASVQARVERRLATILAADIAG
jgi:hypothetical protein